VARIVLGSYAVCFPLGGYLSWVLQWLVGFQRLGHDVFFVECGWTGSCYDPTADRMGDDCSFGTRALDALLRRYDLGDRWCFVDAGGHYHGQARGRVEAAFRGADLFIDMGSFGAWLSAAASTRLRVLIDGEPGAAQIKIATRLAAGADLPRYDAYYTVGRNVGTPRCTVPTAGRAWRPVFYPVVTDLFPPAPPAGDGAAFTTVMSWQAHQPVDFRGRTYGSKDLEFPKFLDLPGRTGAAFELAVAGQTTPTDQLRAAGWRLRPAREVSMTFDAFWDYIRASRGEFSVCKNVFVALQTGWFGDRVGAYLASGRPVVMQDTGFSAHLPCGRGLFAVRTVEEAAAAIDDIRRDYGRHSRAARDIAVEYLDTAVVLRRFLGELGL
jgi:hypothetical protein